MTTKRCGKCGYIFEGPGSTCANCKNGHGSDRLEDDEVTELLDDLFGYTPPKDQEEDE